MLWEAGRGYRYSGTRMSISSIRVFGAPSGCTGYQQAVRGCQGYIGGWQGVSVLGPRRYR